MAAVNSTQQEDTDASKQAGEQPKNSAEKPLAGIKESKRESDATLDHQIEEDVMPRKLDFNNDSSILLVDIKIQPTQNSNQRASGVGPVPNATGHSRTSAKKKSVMSSLTIRGEPKIQQFEPVLVQTAKSLKSSSLSPP